MGQHLHSIQQASFQGTWLTIGTYDGVHAGHQEIVRQMSADAHSAGALAVVVTFHPHPAVVLRRPNAPRLLTLPDERAAHLMEQGADVVITHPFDLQVAATSAQEFIELLQRHLGFEHLWVGYDFAFGRNREGNVERLGQLQASCDFQLQVISPIEVSGEVVSSSRIRTLLLDGNVEQAAHFLGYYYQVSGEVVRGDGRGRTIGFPTANLDVSAEKLIPHSGVYACLARVEQELFSAAVNIGIRPTFDGISTETHVEAHLLDHEADLYGKMVTLEFVARLRREQRFPSVQALIEQIQLDVQQTRELVKTVRENS